MQRYPQGLPSRGGSFPGAVRKLEARPVAPRSGSPASVLQRPVGPMHSLAIQLTILVTLIIYSRLSERIAVALGFNPYLVLILSVPALLLMIPVGGLPRALLAKQGLALTLFTAWMIFVTPFSVWKGGSIYLLRDYWSKAYVLYLMLAGLLVTVEHCRKVLYALGGAALVVEAVALFEWRSAQQRFNLGVGSFSNPNDLAFYLAFSLPGCVLLVLNSRPFSSLRVIGLVSGGVLCVLVFITGSRMGLLMIAAAFVFLWFTTSWVNKAKLFAAATLLGAIAIATSTTGVIQRYQTLWGDPAPKFDATGERGKAIDSTHARKNLLKASLILTAKNPLVGVGPGMFSVAAAEDDYTAKVLFAAWRETHNTFTQVSSETGVPGLLLYLGIVMSVFGGLLRLWSQSRKRESLKQYRHCAYCLMLMLLIFLVGAMFGSSAYNFFLPTLAGVSAALQHAFRADPATSSAAEAAVPPAGSAGPVTWSPVRQSAPQGFRQHRPRST